MPSFEKKAPIDSVNKVNIGAEKNQKPVLPKTDPAVSVMPQKSIKAPPSVLWIGLSGVLTIAFAASIAVGSFLVLNRWVSAFEKVEATYEERSRSVEKIIKNVDQYAQESDDLAQKTQILYEIFKSENKSENQ